MGKIIAVRGTERGDIAYYIAKSLASNNKAVAVIDNSFSKDLFEFMHQYADDGENHVEKESMAFFRDAVVDESFTDMFDYVIFYTGHNTRPQTSDVSFILMKYRMADIEFTKRLEEDVLNDSYIIMLDKVSGKLTEKSIAAELGISAEQVLGSVYLDENDEAAYQNLSFEGRQRISDLSADMQYAVLSMLMTITGDSEAEVRKYYKKAKRNTKF